MTEAGVKGRPQIGVVIPVFNEADNIEGLVRRLVLVTQTVGPTCDALAKVPLLCRACRTCVLSTLDSIGVSAQSPK